MLRERFEEEKKNIKRPLSLTEENSLCKRGVPDVLDMEEGMLIP